MTTLREGEIEFVFGDAWRAEKFDRQDDVGWPPPSDLDKALPGCSARRILDPALSGGKDL